ncbi:alpha/beta-hydrolase [Tothia fuscella]|uniref:Alpha/beta-hydrolase n=1 Tax=Tothia fuscella TaxID=1048955 RepID=A0A9P4NEH4_9PEZI|nr:alpha/beta-hydrolase [Tothia fuscella]
MIDHVLGRPSVKFRKIQVFLVVAFWSGYLYRGNNHGPPYLRRISRLLSRKLTAWQTLLITLLWLYISRNFGKLVGLECPEPLANLYTRSYFRATWITTALDAGFWSAMRIKSKWLRDLSSLVFTVYYLICAEQADEKVRKVRGMLTIDHLRISWDKPTTPYLAAITKLLRPKLTTFRYPPRAIRIPRPRGSAYRDHVEAWLYFDGPIAQLKEHTQVVLDIPGGGFVAMNPRTHDDKLIAWAGKTGLPILSLNYKKAPEYPYPYALNECYDVYHTIIATRGRCIGFSGGSIPRIVVSGDSAGGNLAVGMVLMVIQSASTETRRWHGEASLPPPEGCVLVYPALDMNIGSWMTDEQMALIRDRRTRKTNKGVLRQKSEDYKRLAKTPHASDDELDADSSSPLKPLTGKESAETVVRASSNKTITDDEKNSTHPSMAHIGAPSHSDLASALAESKPKPMKTRLAMSSMISYFNDRIITPEMMRAMIILYIGPHARPDFHTDFLLSPLLAPDSLLAKFPKTYFLTGERDPLVDDTVIFAGRLRQAHAARLQELKEMGLERESREFEEEEFVEVILIPGISHGFFQFVGVFPEGWKHIFRCAEWINDIFSPTSDIPTAPPTPAPSSPITTRTRAVTTPGGGRARHHRRMMSASSGDEDRPLEMSVITSKNSKGGVENGRVDKVEGSGREGRRRAETIRQRRRKSLVRLASEDDLLGRRMKGLTSGLLSLGDEDNLPPTP